jgi:hypothetical protein
VTTWQTPGFYFFNKGKLVSVFLGWPDESQKVKLLEALETIGIGAGV